MGTVGVIYFNVLGAWDSPQGNYGIRLLVCLLNPVTIKAIQLPNAPGKEFVNGLGKL